MALHPEAVYGGGSKHPSMPRGFESRIPNPESRVPNPKSLAPIYFPPFRR